jgi:hypothetical protein
MFWTKLRAAVANFFARGGEITEETNNANDAVENAGNQIWCVVANVVDEHPTGENKQIKRGTKHFSPRAKVYCCPPLWGDDYERVRVVGHHRGSHKLITLVMPSKLLENWRVKMVYAPQIIKRLREHWDDSAESKETANALVKQMKKH